MKNWTALPQLSRSDRFVRRSRVRIGMGVSRHRAVFSIEEALRLTSLPGENEGRSYYFRRLRISELAVSASRHVWLDRFQQVLGDLAARAVHGADSRAPLAEAIFFNTQQEAFEFALCRAARRAQGNEWFWPLVSGTVAEASRAEQAVMLVEQLRRLPSSWIAVASAIFHTMTGEDVRSLLELLPPGITRQWLRELGESDTTETGARPVRLSEATRKLLWTAARGLTHQDPRAIWLAALAVLHENPVELELGRVVEKARAILASSALESPAMSEVKSQKSFIAARNKKSFLPEAERISHAKKRLDFDGLAAPHKITDENELYSEFESTREKWDDEKLSVRVPLNGESTAAGGLFFLLPVLHRLGIEGALHKGLMERHPGFVLGLLKALAADSGVRETDPVVLWLHNAQAEHETRIEASTGSANRNPSPMEAAYWPENLYPTGLESCSTEYLERIWSLAVRRWCWRVGKISVREIVLRTAIFLASPTDLDVTLPLDEVDIRIRRAGLDIDPGWVPWFGWVVRFHYVQNHVENQL